jgi:hypothetical protein
MGATGPYNFVLYALIDCLSAQNPPSPKFAIVWRGSTFALDNDRVPFPSSSMLHLLPFAMLLSTAAPTIISHCLIGL